MLSAPSLTLREGRGLEMELSDVASEPSVLLRDGTPIRTPDAEAQWCFPADAL